MRRTEGTSAECPDEHSALRHAYWVQVPPPVAGRTAVTWRTCIVPWPWVVDAAAPAGAPVVDGLAVPAPVPVGEAGCVAALPVVPLPIVVAVISTR